MAPKNSRPFFYTALYHTMLSPNIYCDVDGQCRYRYLNTPCKWLYTNYSVFRYGIHIVHLTPLMTIINPEGHLTGSILSWRNTRMADNCRSGGWAAMKPYCMIGCHSIPVIADAYQKGIRSDLIPGWRWKRCSLIPTQIILVWSFYRTVFCRYEKNIESVSKTVEYAYDDWCIAQFARMTRYEDNFFIQRAEL